MKVLSGKVTEQSHKTMRIIGAEYDLNLGQVVEVLVLFYGLLQNDQAHAQAIGNKDIAWSQALDTVKNQNQ